MAAADAGTATTGDVVSGDVDLYEILEVDRKASADEIRTSYRRLALAWHPGKLCVASAANKPPLDMSLYVTSHHRHLRRQTPRSRCGSSGGALQAHCHGSWHSR